MGVELAIASLAVSAYSAYEQQQAASDAADARKEAQDINTAQGENRASQQRRQQVREERVRRAKILQSSENTGVGGSSSASGSLSALATNTATNIASGSSDALGAQGIGRANQAALDAQTKGSLWSSVGQLSGTAFAASGGFGTIGDAWGGGQGGGTTPTGGFQSQIFTIPGSTR